MAAGAGLPADYPMSGWSLPPLTVLPRDEQLAARAMQAAVTGAREIVLTEQDIDDLAKDAPDGPTVPHVEIGFRVRAASEQAVSNGDFVVDVRPAWTAGVLSGRFTAVLGSRLSDLYRTLPTMTEGALRDWLSTVGDPDLRRRGLDALDLLERGRAKVAAATDETTLLTALQDLERDFTALTDTAATR
ncbi:lantibiotic dehydratase, partial [Streptomyces werraensis]|uniref:lantibiotic dehydratase n=1 Tax=Streptomyces werraensis TaxID=68284 RepID=UPI0037D539CA